jgi:tetratricopeptide (TPR) repeat protein
VLLPAGAARAGDAAESREGIQRLIAALGAGSARERTQAQEQLLKAGGSAYRQLRSAYPTGKPETDMALRMLLFKMEPLHGPWFCAMRAARYHYQKSDYAEALALFLRAAKKHPPLRRDKWFHHLARRCYQRLLPWEREKMTFSDWELFATGQHQRLVTEHPKSAFRDQSLFRLGRFKQLLKEYPESPLRPYAEYSLLAGHPYFEPPSLLEIRHPLREIQEWPKFLKAHTNHPGLDDAAYRLGRAYELAGDPQNAVKYFHMARTLPDGEYRWKARMRILYVLDALCSPGDLEAIARGAPDPAIREMAACSIGIVLQREERYDQALGAHRRFLASRPDSAFCSKVRKHAERLEKILIPAAARAAGDREADQGAYELGRFYYHNILANYNPIWQGHRAAYLSYEVNACGRSHAFLNPGYFEEHNNYLCAARHFERLLAEHPRSPLREKALYSLGTCYLRAPGLNHFANFTVPRKTLLEKARQAYARLAREHPKSSLADDAARMIDVIKSLPPDWMQY